MNYLQIENKNLYKVILKFLLKLNNLKIFEENSKIYFKK